jgi:hypothetical protein
MAFGVRGGLAGAFADDRDRAIVFIRPAAAETRPWVPEAPAQLAEGRDLFALINGGADLFLRYGFDRAAVQSYNLDGGRQIPAEVFQMRTPDSATGVFADKIGPGDLRFTIGNSGVRGDCYILFRRGRLFATVAAGDTTPDAIAAVLRIARVVETRIPATCL